MATIRKMGKKWQAIIRKKRRQLSKSFEKKSDAVKWSERLQYEILNLCKFPINKLFMSELMTLRVAEFRDDRLLNGKVHLL